MNQSKRSDECRTCSKHGVLGQHLDFENSPTGWILYEKGTKNIHIHKKECDNCRSIIMWSPKISAYINAKEPFDQHFCELLPEDKLPEAETEVRTATTIDPVKAVEPLPQKEETNPIAEAVKNPPSPNLQWDVIKAIKEQTDKIPSIQEDINKLIIAFQSVVQSTDNAVAELAGVKFQTGNELRSSQQPTAEELKDIFKDKDNH